MCREYTKANLDTAQDSLCRFSSSHGRVSLRVRFVFLILSSNSVLIRVSFTFLVLLSLLRFGFMDNFIMVRRGINF